MDNQVFRNLSYGVYIISSAAEGRYTGCTVNSIMQVTSAPPSIALSVNHSNYTHESLEKTGKFAVSILSEKSAPISIGTFGFRSCRDFDKFSVIPYELKSGLPVVKDACGYLICTITGRLETSTHTLYLADVDDGGLLNDETPMTYAYYHKVIKGKSPAAAPSYIHEQ